MKENLKRLAVLIALLPIIPVAFVVYYVGCILKALAYLTVGNIRSATKEIEAIYDL